MKKNIFALSFLLCTLSVAPAMAGPWTTMDPVRLSAQDTSTTLPVGEKLGKIDKLRFSIDGATVQFESLTLIPVKGDPIDLRTPVQLKSGESSGLVNIPGTGVTVDKFVLKYRISGGNPAMITLRLKLD
jgi:hypothetical protein